MRKLLIILCILFFASPCLANQIIIGKKKAVAACTTSNDGEITTSSYVAKQTGQTQTIVCSKVTDLQATDEVTGVKVGMCDGGANAGNITGGLYRHDAVNDEPDYDHVSGAYGSASVAASALTDCGNGDEQVEVLFAATIENIGVTTAWICTTESSSFITRATDNVGSRICYTSTVPPTNGSDWTCYNGNTGKDVVMGCD